MPPLVAIFIWPLISLILFRSYSIPVAIAVSITAGYLLLPHGIEFDLPLLPTLNKHSVPALTALLLVLLMAREKKSTEANLGIVPRHALLRLFIIVLLIGSVMTVFSNSDALRYGPRVLPAMRLYDGFSALLSAIILIVPMILGRSFFTTRKARRLLILLLVTAGLLYSLLALFEVRMSPQLNTWIYGYFQHSWLQHIRSGGWRPIVFLQHGLFLGLFFTMCMVAAIGASRMEPRQRGFFIFAAGWLLLTLVLMKSLGALIIGVVIGALVLFLSPRLQVMAATAICIIFLAYPVLRSTNTIPIDRIVESFSQIDVERAQSLQTRIDNEDILLAKASERPLFGWGAWGRWRVYNNVTGYDETISDGYWIITISEGGWATYLSKVGLLTFPVFLILWRSRQSPISIETSVLCVILAGNIIDLVPNSGLTPLTWLIAGALWARAECGEDNTPTQQTQEAPNSNARAAPVYARRFDKTSPNTEKHRLSHSVKRLNAQSTDTKKETEIRQSSI